MKLTTRRTTRRRTSSLRPWSFTPGKKRSGFSQIKMPKSLTTTAVSPIAQKRNWCLAETRRDKSLFKTWSEIKVKELLPTLKLPRRPGNYQKSGKVLKAKVACHRKHQKLLLQVLLKVTLTVQKMPRKHTTASSPRPGVSLQVKSKKNHIQQIDRTMSLIHFWQNIDGNMAQFFIAPSLDIYICNDGKIPLNVCARAQSGLTDNNFFGKEEKIVHSKSWSLFMVEMRKENRKKETPLNWGFFRN